MRIVIDTTEKILTCEDAGNSRQLPLYSDEAFNLISHQWLKVGWNQKYPYSFSWFGRPIIQIPEDIVRTQEVIYRLKPDVIVETGVAHGGSLVFYASLLKAMSNGGRVIGVDIEIRPHNRKAIEAHEFSDAITLIESDSTTPATIDLVREAISKGPCQCVLVILDSCHTKEHVAKELIAYSPLVTPGSYIVATDGSMQWLSDVPRGAEDWKENNPSKAAEDFAAVNPEFHLEQPKWPFNESTLTTNISHWPSAWLRRQ